MNLSRDNDDENKGSIDEELLPYLRSVSQTDSSEQLQRLLEKARPIVYRITRTMRANVAREPILHARPGPIRHAAFNARDYLQHARRRTRARYSNCTNA